MSTSTAHRVFAAATGVLLLLLAVVGGTTAAPAQASGNGPGVRVVTHGCPAYAMCIYPPGTGWNHDVPLNYWRFPAPGTHYELDFHNMYGTYRVFNNGLYLYTCGWTWDQQVSLNTGYRGGGQHFWIHSGRSYDVNLTPYNSFTMWYRSYANGGTCP